MEESIDPVEVSKEQLDESTRHCIVMSDGSGFSFTSSEVIAHLHIPQLPESDSNEESGSSSEEAPQFYQPLALPPTSIRMHSFTETDTVHGAKSYWTEIELQPIAYYLDLLESSSLFVPFIYISVSLDGCTIPPREEWCKLHYYRSLARYSLFSPAAPPKAGFTAGTSITLKLNDYCPEIDEHLASILLEHHSKVEGNDNTNDENNDTNDDNREEENMNAPAPDITMPPLPQRFTVRIRGAPTEEIPEGASVVCPAELSVEEDTEAEESNALYSLITFTIPTGVTATPGMTPVAKGKEKLFFVDISIDGGSTFDCAESALIQLK